MSLWYSVVPEAKGVILKIAGQAEGGATSRKGRNVSAGITEYSEEL